MCRRSVCLRLTHVSTRAALHSKTVLRRKVAEFFLSLLEYIHIYIHRGSRKFSVPLGEDFWRRFWEGDGRLFLLSARFRPSDCVIFVSFV